MANWALAHKSLKVVYYIHMTNYNMWHPYGHMGGYDGFGFGHAMHGSGFVSPFGLLGIAGIGIFVVLLIIWTISIKGYALWHAGRRNEPWWFFFLLIVNTFGIFELIYLIFVAKVLFNKPPHDHAAHDHSAHDHPAHHPHSPHHPPHQTHSPEQPHADGGTDVNM